MTSPVVEVFQSQPEVVVSQSQAVVQVDESGAVSVVEVLVTATPELVEVITPGPQGPAGPQGPPGPASEDGLPTGGDTGNILIKESAANYDASWTPYLDGGTFF